MPIDLDTLTPEERELATVMKYSSWDLDDDAFQNHDHEIISAIYASDAISMPSDHAALRGHQEIQAFYKKRAGDFPLFVESDVDAVDIVGEVAVVTGIFRACRRAEKGVAAFDHGGRYLAVFRKVDGAWKFWRDMDCPSPDADVFYDRHGRDR